MRYWPSAQVAATLRQPRRFESLTAVAVPGIEEDLPLASSELTAVAGLVDGLFEAAFRSGLAAVPPHRRTGALSGTTGHVAESVVELLLVDVGYSPIWHFTGPGRHGVDLLMLGPEADHVRAVEVKGTLRSGHWPRLTTGELQQMSGAWLDKIDNPGMAEWDLHADDIYGAVVLVRLAERRYKVGITADHAHLHPLTEPLADLDTAVLHCPRNDRGVTRSSA